MQETNGAPEDTVVPVLAEEVRVGKKAVPTGAVRVHRKVHEHEETVDVPLLKEHVDVRRVLIEREVDGPLPVRRDGDTTIIPIVEEVLVISKKFMLKEEVHVLRTVREERHHEQVVVRRQEPEIERIDESGRALSVDTPPAKERTRRPKGKSMIADVYRKP